MLDRTLESVAGAGAKPSLLLHACCAPCSSYVLEYLNRYFDITVLFYNPNITEADEYERRSAELKRLVSELPCINTIAFTDGGYSPSEFESISKGLESEREGGARCMKCYRLRLEHTALTARSGGYDFFTTTLSISPHKNAQALNSIGAELAEKYGVSWLYSDFKKKNGYKRSCELSAVYGLYRQDYCGCIYSKREAEERRKTKQ